MNKYKKWFEVKRTEDDMKEFERRSNMPKFQRALDNLESILDRFGDVLTDLEKEKLKNASNNTDKQSN